MEPKTRGTSMNAKIPKSALQEIRNVKQPKHKRRSEPCVPSPPDSPDRMRPNRAGYQYDRGEHQSDFRRGDCQPVPARFTSPNVQEVREKTDEERSKPGPRTRK